MKEDHWDTRQEYIKLGNELAALDAKQEQEKKEQEKALKEMQERMSSVTYQANQATSSGGELNPVFVPQKHEERSSSLEPSPSLMPQTPLPEQKMSSLDSARVLENRGKMGFQNNTSTATFQRPFGQNSNPFQNNGGRF